MLEYKTQVCIATLPMWINKVLLYTRNQNNLYHVFDQVVQKDEAETELASSTMAVFVIREEGNSLQPPHDVGVVIDGVKVLNMLPSVAHACAMLFGLIYVLNLSYPGELKNTFDALQKLFMEIEPKKMARKVLSLSVHL